MFVSRKTIVTNVICLLIIVISGVIHVTSGNGRFHFAKNNIIFILYAIAVLTWLWQIRRRILQKYVYKYITYIAVLMIFWMGARNLRYVYIPFSHPLSRYMWYFYYFSMLFMALFVFFSVLFIGKKEEENIDRRWKLLYIPTILFFLLIITNDYYELAFKFHNGLEGWSTIYMDYGIAYFATMTYFVSLIIASVIIMFIRCSIYEKRKYIWVPILPLLVGGLFCIAVVTRINFLSNLLIAFKVSEVGCIVFGIFLESLILTHLIPSNDGYENFWNMLSLRAGIMDYDGKEHFKSLKGVSINKEDVYGEKDNNILLDDETILQSFPINGGRSYWLKDISQINKLNEELKELGDIISEENEMLKFENQIKEESVRIKQKSDLYHEIAKKLKPQLDKLSRIFKNLPQEEIEFIEKMKRACVLNAYIKRYTNLLLLSEDMEYIDFYELKLAFDESVEYLELSGIETYLNWSAEGEISTEKAILIYEIFEQILENSFLTTKAILIDCTVFEKKFVLSMQIDNPEIVLSEDMFERKLSNSDGYITIEYDLDDRTEHIYFSISSGGVL